MSCGEYPIAPAPPDRLSCSGCGSGASRLTGGKIMPVDHPDPAGRDQTSTWIELAIRLAVLGLLVYLAFILIRPFITIAIWSVVLTVALYPGYDRMVGWLGGRRRLAAVLLTVIGLLVLLGPATWLVLSLIDSLSSLSERLDLAHFTVPTPPASVKEWPLVGAPIYQFWDLASTNLQAAVAKIAPQLRPVGSGLLTIAAGAGTGALAVPDRPHRRGFSVSAGARTGRCRQAVLAPAGVRTGRSLRPHRRGDDPGRRARRDRRCGAAVVPDRNRAGDRRRFRAPA